jgi:hypothetical protein
MIGRNSTRAIRKWGLSATATAATAVVLIAADQNPDANWSRIRALPVAERTKLADNLKLFDKLGPEQQKAILNLDRRLTELDRSKQSQYLTVMRRYHNWLASLPANRRDELLSRPTDERMGLIRKLALDFPLPKAETPRAIRIAELGEYSPFELASIFKICQTATPDALEKVDRVAQGPRRREVLFRLGEDLRIPREIVPANFDAEKWIGMVERQWKNRPAFLLDELIKKKQENRRADILRRQAINLYYVSTEVRSVDPDRLLQFVASLPTWVQATLDHYPPDEARRRLSFAYRLVFPFPEEIKAKRPQTRAPRPAPARPAPGPGDAKPKAAEGPPV